MYPLAGIFGTPQDDLAAVERLIRKARDIGYTGVAVMHPTHVAIANTVYRPTPEEVAPSVPPEVLAKGITAPIIGATESQHLDDAVAALSLELSAAETASRSRLSRRGLRVNAVAASKLRRLSERGRDKDPSAPDRDAWRHRRK